MRESGDTATPFVGRHQELEALRGALEAAPRGRVVVALVTGGAAPEIVRHGRTGFLCTDEDDMAAAAVRLAEIDRQQCRAAVTGYFSATRMVGEYVELFRDILTDVHHAAGLTERSRAARLHIAPLTRRPA
jgi:glycosyltransferase involved in cell wall biosynthesis